MAGPLSTPTHSYINQNLKIGVIVPEAVSNIREITTTSDGSVKISVEKYNELLEKARIKPPVITKKTVIKTPEMAAKEFRMWGGGLMGLGVAIFIVGASLYTAGLK